MDSLHNKRRLSYHPFFCSSLSAVTQETELEGNKEPSRLIQSTLKVIYSSFAFSQKTAWSRIYIEIGGVSTGLPQFHFVCTPYFMLGACILLSLHYPGSPLVLSLELTQISLELSPPNLKHLYKPSAVFSPKAGTGTIVTQFQNRYFISHVIYLNLEILISSILITEISKIHLHLLMAGLLVHFQLCFICIGLVPFSESMHSLINRLPIFPLSQGSPTPGP